MKNNSILVRFAVIRILGFMALIYVLPTVPFALEAAFGLHGGGDLGHVWQKDYERSEFKLQYHAGGLGYLKLAPFLAMQIEADYQRLSTEYTTKISQSIDTQLVTSSALLVQAINIPLVIKIIAPGYEEKDPHILIGAFYRYGLDVEFNESVSTLVGPSFTPQSNQAKNIDQNQNRWGLIGGLGIDFASGTFDIRYNWVVTELAKSPNNFHEGWISATFGFFLR